MKTAKEITIDYLESIKRNRKNAIQDIVRAQISRLSNVMEEEKNDLKNEVGILDLTIKIVKKSEGE